MAAAPSRASTGILLVMPDKTELARVRRELARLQRENDHLRTQLVGFARGPHPLTPAQHRLYDQLAAAIRTHGIAPSVRELQALLGVHSPTSVIHHLDALEAKGWIARKAGKARAIRLLVRPGEEDAL